MPNRLLRHKTISEIADHYGLTHRTIRFYEDRGLLTPLRLKLERFYSEADEIRLQIILKGKRLGFTLSEIDQLLKANREQETPTTRADGLVLQFHADELERRITRLERERDEKLAAIGELRASLERFQERKADGSPSG